MSIRNDLGLLHKSKLVTEGMSFFSTVENCY